MVFAAPVAVGHDLPQMGLGNFAANSEHMQCADSMSDTWIKPGAVAADREGKPAQQSTCFLLASDLNSIVPALAHPRRLPEGAQDSPFYVTSGAPGKCVLLRR